MRGTFHAHRLAAPALDAAGISATVGPHRRLPGSGPVLVASYQDARACSPRRVVLVNHGAGQTYEGAGVGHPSYSGGRGRENVGLNLSPGPADAQRCRDAQPDVRAVAVGVAALDAWHSGARGPQQESAHTRPIVALSHHFDLRLVPETRWAFPFYQQSYPGLAADRRWTLLGHGHPRAWVALSREWARLGIPSTPSFADVLDRADLFVVDNSSTAFEFASTGRPVLLLNAPWYRKNVEHGLRFWTNVPGLQCDRPEDLADAVALALSDPPEAQALRRAAVAAVYDGLCDGHASERAAAAVVAWLEEGDVGPVRPQARLRPSGRG